MKTMNAIYYSELEKLIGKQIIFTYGEDDQRPDTIFVGEYVGDEDRNDIHSEIFDEASELVLWNSEDQYVDLKYALANLVTDLTDSPYFSICGYWKNNKEKFEGYIISKYDKFIMNWGFEEDDIFFYGIDPFNYDNSEEFVITSFNRIGVKPFPKII